MNQELQRKWMVVILGTSPIPKEPPMKHHWQVSAPTIKISSSTTMKKAFKKPGEEDTNRAGLLPYGQTQMCCSQ